MWLKNGYSLPMNPEKFTSKCVCQKAHVIRICELFNFFKKIFSKLNRAPLDYKKITGQPIQIYTSEGTNQIPLALSVDWLNDKLYILFESDDTVNKLV